MLFPSNSGFGTDFDDKRGIGKNLGPENPALVIPRGDLLCWSFIDLLKFQISNKFQHAAQAPALRVTKIRKSKQCLVKGSIYEAV